MTAEDKLFQYTLDILPHGRFWQDTAADNFAHGVADSLGPAATLIDTLDEETAPFNAQRPVLLNWLDYLRRVDCVATPIDTEELRDRVLMLLAAESTAFPEGFENTVHAYLPLVEIRDDLPLSVVGTSYTSAGTPVLLVPFPCDPHWAVVEIWYSPLIYTEDLVVCVARPFAPGVSVIRPVIPIAIYSLQGLSASQASLQWDEMRADTDITVVRSAGGPPIETVVLTSVQPRDIQTFDQIFPLLGPADAINAMKFEASFERTWLGQTSQTIDDVILNVP